MLKVGEVKEIYEMKGAGRSIRGIAGELGIARNTVRRYLKSPEAIRAKPRSHRASKLDPYTGYIDRRLHEGLENCVVLHRELRARGYDGCYSILNRSGGHAMIALTTDDRVRAEAAISGETII